MSHFRYTDTGLTNGTSYYYEVVPVFAGGVMGPGSNIEYAIPHPGAIPWESTPQAIIQQSMADYGWNTSSSRIQATLPNGCIVYGSSSGTLIAAPDRTMTQGSNMISDAGTGDYYLITWDPYEDPTALFTAMKHTSSPWSSRNGSGHRRAAPPCRVPHLSSASGEPTRWPPAPGATREFRPIACNRSGR